MTRTYQYDATYPHVFSDIICLPCKSHKFTGKERDSESNLDYFGARYYSSQYGRFMTPDEFKGGIVDPFTGQDIETNTALPYADITDPQTLNKYAYVRNNPLRYTDPTGHCPECITALIGAGAGFVSSIVVQMHNNPNQDINWRAVGISTLSGAVAGATFGVLTAPAAITSLATASTVTVSTAGVGEIAAAGAISGVVGGTTGRTATTGSLDAALADPGEIAKDAKYGAGGALVGKALVGTVNLLGGQIVEQMKASGATAGQLQNAQKVVSGVALGYRAGVSTQNSVMRKLDTKPACSAKSKKDGAC